MCHYVRLKRCKTQNSCANINLLICLSGPPGPKGPVGPPGPAGQNVSLLTAQQCTIVAALDLFLYKFICVIFNFLSASKQGKPGVPGTQGPVGPKGERGERVSKLWLRLLICWMEAQRMLITFLKI